VPYCFCRWSWADADAFAAQVAWPGADGVAEADEITKWRKSSHHNGGRITVGGVDPGQD
jgi:hypothetical protein